MRIRGPVNKRLVSGDRMAALARGDIDELMRINRAEFGGAVMMADPDDDDDDDDDGNDDDDAGEAGKKKKTGSDSGDDPDDGDDDGNPDLERALRRMRAADKRADEAQAELKKIQDAKKDDLTKANDEVVELKGQVETLQSEVSGLRLQNAFLTSNSQTWHDPDTALALAQTKKYLEDVVDEESGEVDRPALKKALDRLAKEHPYLVKTEDKKKEDPPDPSGESAGGRSDNNQDDKAKKSKMKQRFPVLNR